jgi:hypothetical protein
MSITTQARDTIAYFVTLYVYYIWRIYIAVPLGIFRRSMNWIVKTLDPTIIPVLNRALKYIPKLLGHYAGINTPTTYELTNLCQLRNAVLEAAITTIVQIPLVSDTLKKTYAETKCADRLALFHYFNVYADGTTSEPLSISFSSNSWLVLYELGVAKCLQTCIVSEILAEATWIGTGSGSLVASCLALDIDIDEVSVKLIDLAISSSSHLFGSPDLTRDLRKVLNDVIWKDIERCNGRLGISTFSLNALKTVMTHEFVDKQVL